MQIFWFSKYRAIPILFFLLPVSVNRFMNVKAEVAVEFIDKRYA